MKQLSGLDASFLFLETENAPMHVTGVAVLAAESSQALDRVDF